MSPPLGKPLTIAEVSAELRDKVRRLRVEISADETLRPSGHVMLAWALIDAVNDEFAGYLETTDPEQRKVYQRAIELADRHSMLPGDDMHRFITWGAPGQQPIIAMFKGRNACGVYVEEPVLALQYLLGDLKPLWVQYIGEAQRQIGDEARSASDKEKAA